MKRIDNLTGVRAVAAFWVVLYHLNAGSTTVHGRLGKVVAHGMIGVDLFFILSGFVLSLVYVDRMPERFCWTTYRAFLLRRFAKIFPLHLLTLLSMIGLVAAAARLHFNFTADAENTRWTALCSAFMLHSLGLTRTLSWNVPSWSVSAEWFAYVVLFVPMVFLLRGLRTWHVAAGAVALLVVLGLSTPLLGVPWTSLDARGALRILPDFLCGYLLYRLMHNKHTARGDLLSGIGAALLALTCYLPHGSLWLMAPAIMVLLAGLYAGGPLVDRVLGSRLLVRLGDASYSIYLLHMFVLIAAKQCYQRLHVHDTVFSRVAMLVTVMLTTSAAGLLCFCLVEEPLRLMVLRAMGRKGKNPEARPASLVPGTAADTQVSATVA